MKQKVSLDEITRYYRILGLPFDATLEMCRQKRNRLINKFHPDKHPQGWTADETTPESRMHLIQMAYQFILEHYDEIQDHLKHESPNTLSSSRPRALKSHWVYDQIENIKK